MTAQIIADFGENWSALQRMVESDVMNAQIFADFSEKLSDLNLHAKSGAHMS